MALASLGALTAMLVTYALNRRYQRDFNREWAESLRIKGKKPLGEDALAKMVRDATRR
jgi:putative membrane protein